MAREYLDDRGFKIFIENPYWKEYYDNAPSEALKAYIKDDFNNNPFVCSKPDPDPELKAALTKDDVQYLLEKAVGGREKSYYKKWMDSLQ